MFTDTFSFKEQQEDIKILFPGVLSILKKTLSPVWHVWGGKQWVLWPEGNEFETGENQFFYM